MRDYKNGEGIPGKKPERFADVIKQKKCQKTPKEVITDDFFRRCAGRCFVTNYKHITDEILKDMVEGNIKKLPKKFANFKGVIEKFPKAILIGKQIAKFPNKLSKIFPEYWP